MALATAGCTGGGAVRTAPPPVAAASEAIPGQLERSAEAWNRGDLDGFLEPYLHDGRVSFVGSSGLVRGYEALRNTYAQGYWKNGPPRTKLTFEGIDVTPTGTDAALAVGRYVLTDPVTGSEADRGIFSLTWIRTGEGWRILHDHSSSTR